jgi:protein-disulfide isomerase
LVRVCQAKELTLLINRREFGAATAALATAVLATGMLPPFSRKAWADDTVPTAELMKPEALPDLVLGSDKAPVTIVEYASMTCPHCAHFAEKTFPELKKKYIDTGKVRYILREFPLDSLAAAAFMLARCAGETDKNKYYALVDTLFRKQTTWAVQQPIPPLQAIAKQVGFTDASFKACLTNQKLLDDIEKVRQRAIDKFKVHSTPTFFINGSVHEGALSFDEMAKIIDPYLKGG